MSASEFLKGLPSYNEDNFTKWNSSEGSTRNVSKKPAVYLPTTDHPSEQIITTEKTNILLRYLHQQRDKKQCSKKELTKRETNREESDENSARKRARNEDNGNDSVA